MKRSNGKFPVELDDFASYELPCHWGIFQLATLQKTPEGTEGTQSFSSILIYPYYYDRISRYPN